MKRFLTIVVFTLGVLGSFAAPVYASPVYRYNAIWVPSTTNQFVVWGWTLDAFKAKYNEMWNQGMRLVTQQAYDIGNGQFRYDGVWNPSTENQLVVWGWTLKDFHAKYDEMWKQGMRLVAQQAYDIGGGQFRYDGIWNPSTENQLVVWGWTLDDFKAKYNEMSNQGFRLAAQQSYNIGGGQYRYDGIWNPSTFSQFVVWGWKPQDIQDKHNKLIKQGMQLVTQQAYDTGNSNILYDAVWSAPASPQYVVWGWTLDDIRKAYADQWKLGYRLSALQVYTFSGSPSLTRPTPAVTPVPEITRFD